MKSAALLAMAVLCVSVTALDSYSGRVAVVTGASSGIGKAIATALVKKGMNVVGIDIQYELLQNVSESLKGEPGKLIAKKCDVRKEEEVVSIFQWIEDNLGGAIAVLVNSAGVAISGNLIDGNASYWRDMLDTNVYGLSICTREAVRRMVDNDVDDAHIIQISSTAGFYYFDQPDSDMYAASKYAVTTLVQTMRKYLNRLNSSIRVTCIFPGTTNTPMIWNPDFFVTPEDVDTLPKLEPEDLADGVLYVLGTPSRVQIVNLLIQPTGDVV